MQLSELRQIPMTTTVVPCSKCGLPVRLREGETSVRCTGCGASVRTTEGGANESTGGNESTRQTILSLSLLIVAAGLGTLAFLRHHKSSLSTPAASPTAIYSAPAVLPVVPTPEGELAWEPAARAPVLARVNADDVDDIIGFFRIWDGRSAWTPYAGAFDGATMKLLWRSEAVDPQLIKQAHVLPLAVVAGRRVLIADTSSTLRVFDVATGEKQSTLRVSGPVIDVCPSPDSSDRVWVRVDGGGDMLLDLGSAKSDLAPRPKWCPEPQYQIAVVPTVPTIATPKDLLAIAEKTAEVNACDHTFENGKLARAACRAPSPSSAPAGDDFHAEYELSDAARSVAVGTKLTRPMVRSTTKGTAWEHELVASDIRAKPGSPPIADLAFDRVYAVSERLYFDAQLTALDAGTGAVLWETPLVGSLPRSDGSGRGEARGLVATASRLYVIRAGGGLDIFDASSGKPVGSIGKQ